MVGEGLSLGTAPRWPPTSFKVKRGGKELLTTQCYVKGHPGNDRDGIYRSVRDAMQRDAITVAFEPLKGSKIDELTAKFDIVLGATPEG